jgi:hypothetical protein
MRHQEQVDQARKLLSYLNTRTTAMADNLYRDPGARGGRTLEREVFFDAAC